MKIRFLAHLFFSLIAIAAPAQVRVAKSFEHKVSIDLSGVRTGAQSTAQTFLKTLENDLRLSGWLRPVRAEGEIELSGSVETSGGDLRATLYAMRRADRTQLLSKGYALSPERVRALAHRAADDLVRAITGHRGMASTRIALIGTQSGHKELWLCDADGQGRKQLTTDRNISVAPTWGPQGTRIFYTSFVRGFPDIYQIDLQRGKRTQISGRGGLNTGAALSPDGKTLALILSKDGNPELYLQQLPHGTPQRMTRTLRATEASPCWSPDGNHLVFVSDQSGSPQLYLIHRSGGQPKRLSRRGAQNVAPDWGPNGLIACASRDGGRYRIAVINPTNGDTRYLTDDGADYEDPTWAPDGRHLAASRTARYQSDLYLLDTLNDPPVALIQGAGNWFSPAWSPR